MTTPLVLPDATVWVRLEEESAVGTARRAAQQLAARLGFSDERASEVGLAVTELATNLVKHAGHGTVVLRPLRDDDPPAVEVLVLDSGPGIADLPRALLDGTSTTGTLGIGLGAVRRLADDWDLYTRRGGGTTVTATFLPRPPGPAVAPAAWRTAGVVRPMTGESESGDAYAVRVEGERCRLLLVDGLGHGPMAARAAQAAVRVFSELPAGSTPTATVQAVHRGLSGTRGAAAAAVDVDRTTGRVRIAGVGNVAAYVVAPGSRRGLVSLPGILGHQVRTFREFEHALPPGGAVVMHSDGLSDKWSLEDYPGLLAHSPLTFAAVLLRDVGVRRDDAGVLVAKAV